MDLTDFFHQAGLLKKIKRSGWKFIGIEGESVADHSYRTALIAYFLSNMEGLNESEREDAILLSLLHDLPESRTLDLNKLTKKYVKVDEQKALAHTFAGFPQFRKLFSKKKILTIVKDADALEMAFQAKEYMDAGNKNAKSWLENAGKRLKTPSAKKIYEDLNKKQSYQWVMKARK